MSEPTLCLNRKFLIKGATADQVISESHKAMKDLGLNVKREATIDGKTSVFAVEGALVPIVMRVISYPWKMSEYVKSAQRAGIHVLVSQAPDGVYLYACGLSVNDLTGRPEKYPEITVEEITDTLKALDFEEKFIKTVLAAFSDVQELKLWEA